MDITRLVVGPLEVNCYLVRNQESGLAAVIDPGGDPERIIEQCEKAQATAVYLINTHGHIDHIGANAHLKRTYPDAKLCIGTKDAPLLVEPTRNLPLQFGGPVEPLAADVLLSEGDRLEVGGIVLEVLETPGHTPGSISLRAGDGENVVLFCGDLLFAGSVGRTDLPGGNMAQLRNSVQRKVFALPESTVILPGHGPETTVGQEKRTNPYVGAVEFC